MEVKHNENFEKLAYSIKLVYELRDRIKTGEFMRALIVGLSFGRTNPLLFDYIEGWVIGDQKYKDAISTLETEFGHIHSVRNILEMIYYKCPTLKPKNEELSKGVM